MMATLIHSESFLEHGTHLYMEHRPNPWTSWHVEVVGVLSRSFDSLISATEYLMEVAEKFGGSADATLDSVIKHFDDDKIYRSDDDSNPFLVNEYEWDED